MGLSVQWKWVSVSFSEAGLAAFNGRGHRAINAVRASIPNGSSFPSYSPVISPIWMRFVGKKDVSGDFEWGSNDLGCIIPSSVLFRPNSLFPRFSKVVCTPLSIQELCWKFQSSYCDCHYPPESKSVGPQWTSPPPSMTSGMTSQLNHCRILRSIPLGEKRLVLVQSGSWFIPPISHTAPRSPSIKRE